MRYKYIALLFVLQANTVIISIQFTKGFILSSSSILSAIVVNKFNVTTSGKGQNPKEKKLNVTRTSKDFSPIDAAIVR